MKLKDLPECWVKTWFGSCMAMFEEKRNFGRKVASKEYDYGSGVVVRQP